MKDICTKVGTVAYKYLLPVFTIRHAVAGQEGHSWLIITADNNVVDALSTDTAGVVILVILPW